MPFSFPIRQIFGIGQNYAAHARELGSPLPERPVMFTKNPAAALASGAEIVIPLICREHGPQVDFEGELAVIIGASARDVPKAQALEHVMGYAAANDVSARWWQKQGSGGQFCRGKSFDTFCPLSRIRPAAEVPDPQALRIITRLNGAVMQDSPTSDMIFSVADLISELSRGMTLMSGTVILTGTPSGVGAGRTPPVFLKDGDEIEVEIDGVGVVSNRVVEEKP
ncbi:hypothetical protein BH11PLA1_BH11PLA1_10700 [soil metagenome]